MVSHAQLPHLLDVVKISAIDDDRLPESAFHPVKIGVAVLVPVSDHNQRVRTHERLIVSLRIIYSVAEQSSCMIDGGRVVRTDRDPFVEESLDESQRRRFAHVIGAGLERQTPQRDAPAFQLLAQRVAHLLDQHSLLPFVR